MYMHAKHFDGPINTGYLLHQNSSKHQLQNLGKGTVLLYSLAGVGSGADPAVQASDVLSHTPAVGCHYFPPG